MGGRARRNDKTRAIQSEVLFFSLVLFVIAKKMGL